MQSGYLMTYRGRVENGQIVLDSSARLPEGAIVEVKPIALGHDPADDLADEAVATGIPDLAYQHDHYLYGLPKRAE
jgi:hypothetical protein